MSRQAGEYWLRSFKLDSYWSDEWAFHSLQPVSSCAQSLLPCVSNFTGGGQSTNETPGSGAIQSPTDNFESLLGMAKSLPTSVPSLFGRLNHRLLHIFHTGAQSNTGVVPACCLVEASWGCTTVAGPQTPSLRFRQPPQIREVLLCCSCHFEIGSHASQVGT